jgi:hypothetical protein
MNPHHLVDAASVTRRTLEPFAGRDWAVPAGDLTWSVRRTISHLIDAVGWYAAHLAAQSPRRLLFDFAAHGDAANLDLLDLVEASAATLSHVARAAPPGACAYHDARMADASGFVAMGCDEILVHGWDAARAFGVDLIPPDDLANQVLRRLFPWVPLETSSWDALLWANGRVDLPGRPHRPEPDWVWHCAPLEEWDGKIPRQYLNAVRSPTY